MKSLSRPGVFLEHLHCVLAELGFDATVTNRVGVDVESVSSRKTPTSDAGEARLNLVLLKCHFRRFIFCLSH